MFCYSHVVPERARHVLAMKNTAFSCGTFSTLGLQWVPNVEMRVRLEPLDDPLGSLPTLWCNSLKELVKDLGLEDPNLAGLNDIVVDVSGVQDSSVLVQMAASEQQNCLQKSAACSVS
uniref:Uncharacterized protein n=1 Tax=Hemiselmis andersenii TaxID=464988 RepID=A0A7S0UC72_HEMAN|mmetsp:Transcript_40964/g.95041  ORF Transcript_40964/g.95041 Transcript_40964/m.95041 type:complete len:118 (+) Transcript_40964:23-376(+)